MCLYEIEKGELGFVSVTDSSNCSMAWLHKSALCKFLLLRFDRYHLFLKLCYCNLLSVQ